MKGDRFFEGVATQRPFSKMHPQIAAFFKEYLSTEKVLPFGDAWILNSHFPPFPSRAFETMADNFGRIGEVGERRLHSVTLGVTNRCRYRCWHCYNAGRSQEDLPLSVIREVAVDLQRLGAVMITLSGGEPLLRGDLEEIAKGFDDRSCLCVNTTGDGLTPDRARALRDSGIFGVGVSLDSIREEEHDRMRGKEGAYRAALRAVDLAGRCGFYPYVISVATRAFLEPDHFWPFVEFSRNAGAREVHVIEPCATGRLQGNRDISPGKEDRNRILGYQREIAGRDDLPILSSFTYLESSSAFGCGAGITHFYIDGSGEVCPCNLVPMSFGNVRTESVGQILDRMGQYFRKPRSSCVGKLLSRHIPGDRFPTPPELSLRLVKEHLPSQHSVPRFFRIKSESRKVGKAELRSAYNKVGRHYDEFWLREAAAPIRDLIGRLPAEDVRRILEAGCGTGYATALLAGKYGSAEITAVDLSGGMLEEARARVEISGVSDRIRFVMGDALEVLSHGEPYDVVFSSWVLGYIRLNPFFEAAHRALHESGRLAFVVHQENSPVEPMQIFNELVARDPTILQKQVDFDFPPDMDRVRSEVAASDMQVRQIWEGRIVFRYGSPEQVLEHLLKSGAGTAFYDAILPDKRESLRRDFLAIHAERCPKCEVAHDYISCIAQN